MNLGEGGEKNKKILQTEPKDLLLVPFGRFIFLEPYNKKYASNSSWL